MNEWISVESQLPPDGETVFVTIERFDRRHVMADARYIHDTSDYIQTIREKYPNGAWEYLADSTLDYWDILDTVKVVAWMKYPEPYMENW